MKTGRICKLIWQISSCNLHLKNFILYLDCMHQKWRLPLLLASFSKYVIFFLYGAQICIHVDSESTYLILACFPLRERVQLIKSCNCQLLEFCSTN